MHARAVALAVILVTPALASGQTCVGAASFAAAPVRVGAGFVTSDGVKSYGLNLAAGSGMGIYGSATLSRAEYDNVQDAGVVVGGAAGYAINLTPTAQFCPEIGYQYQTGPNVDTGFGTVDASANAFNFGGSVGGAVPMSSTLDFVPFASADYVISQVNLSGAGISSSSSQGYGLVGIGAGFVVNKVLTMQPMIAVPVGLQGGKSSFQLALAYNFGSSSAHP